MLKFAGAWVDILLHCGALFRQLAVRYPSIDSRPILIYVRKALLDISLRKLFVPQREVGAYVWPANG